MTSYFKFIAVRKTLEANMQMSNLYPPGRVLWALRDSDLHPSHRKGNSDTAEGDDKLRLFEVLDAEKVFSQIVFAKDMLRCIKSVSTKCGVADVFRSAHMPHRYDRVLHDLL